MKMEDCKIRKIKEGERKKHITIRVSLNGCGWMKENNLSPTAIFNQAIVELGYKKKSN